MSASKGGGGGGGGGGGSGGTGSVNYKCNTERWWERKRDATAMLETSLDAMPAAVQQALETSRGYPAPELIAAIADAAGVDPQLLRQLCTQRRNRARARASQPPLHYHFLYFKPRGVMSQPKQFKREEAPSIADSLPAGFPTGVPMCGRLDADTEGYAERVCQLDTTAAAATITVTVVTTAHRRHHPSLSVCVSSRTIRSLCTSFHRARLASTARARAR